MAHSDSEDDVAEDLDLEDSRTSEGDAEEDAEIDEDLLDGVGEDGSEGDEDSGSEEDEEGSEDDDEGDDEENEEHSGDPPMDLDIADSQTTGINEPSSPSMQMSVTSDQDGQTRARTRSLSPAAIRRRDLFSALVHPRSYTVEAISAIAHPSPTHALSASACMSHLLTGSDDGYIRDYDIFSAVNGKVFLSAPQRHHCGVVEGILKAGVLRSWWENPDAIDYLQASLGAEPGASPVYSLATQSDALWTLAGTDAGHINLFTVRQEPGHLCHVFNEHRAPVSSLALDHDEQGFYSAGWDGEAYLWDLNTGKRVRSFEAHGAQLVGVAVRPIAPTQSIEFGQGSAMDLDEKTPRDVAMTPHANGVDTGIVPPNSAASAGGTFMNAKPTDMHPTANKGVDEDAKSEASYDPLFDEPDGDMMIEHKRSEPSNRNQAPAFGINRSAAPPKNAPPILDNASYATFSPDILMTTWIDGQIILWDKRVNTPGQGVGRLWMSEKTPPWCLSACWSSTGEHIYAGRRNGAVEIYDMRQFGRSGTTNTSRLLKTLRNPLSSGQISCVVAFPDGRHLACASKDNIRLWNVAEAAEVDASGKTRGGVQFKIIPGHHGGQVSQMIVDPAARFMVSASSNRGWFGDSTRTVFVHDVKHIT